MLKYQTPPSKPNTPAQKIDLLRAIGRMNASLNHSTVAIEKDQIESIRAMTQYLLLEQTDSTVTFQVKGRTAATGQGMHDRGKEKGMSIYERGQQSERKKFEKIVKANREQTQKIMEMSKSSANTFNVSNTKVLNKQGAGKGQPISYKNKDAFVVNQLLKKCVKQEGQIHTVRQRQKKLNGYQTHSYINLTNQVINSPKKKQKRKATQEQLKIIFEQVNQRSEQLKKRKQKKIENYLQERYQRQMEGVTFHPHLQSSKNLRNNCTQGFLRRLQDDHQNREKQKIQILMQQLRRDSFQPKLNIQRNSLSKSKVQSFRMEDSLFFTPRSRPENVFQKNLSRFIYPEQDSMPQSKVNQSMEIALKASELQFLFQ